MALIRFKRGTRANLNSAASNNSLNQGEPYYTTDDQRLAVGTTASAYTNVVTSTTIGNIWTGTQSQYDGLGTYDANTFYAIIEP